MTSKSRCECIDRGCAAHPGRTCGESARRIEHGVTLPAVLLKRVDMEDRTGTLFCAACAEDALQSRLYQ
jgi:hypothetical protein